MRRGLLILIALLIAAVTHILVRELQVVLRAELLVYDWHLRALPPLAADSRLVFVGMDDASLAQLPLDRPAYPLPRSMHAKVVRELHAAGARAIAFDVMFTLPAPADDPAFAEALEASPPVFCGAEPSAQTVDGEELITLTPPTPVLKPHLTACALNTPTRFSVVRWLNPVVVDAATSEQYVHMSAALAEQLGGAPTPPPPGAENEVLIRFLGPPGTFKPIPYHEVFNGTWRQAHGSDFFKDKVILIGTVSPLVDRARTPFGDMQGSEALLHATQTIATGNWIRHASEGFHYLLKSLLCIVLALAIGQFGSRRAFVIFGVETALLIVVSHRIFISSQLWIDTFEPSLAMLFTLVAASAYEAGRVRKVFHRFMPSWVAEKMLDSNPEDAATTREVEASVVFCDVRNSTRLAEVVTSKAVEDLLRRYFTAGEESAVRLGTELDKFVGDEIMLYFEERRGMEDHALRAVRWAFDIQKACAGITATGLAGDVGFRVGVGISSGLVRIGTVGAKRRIQHTVIGDTVNTASRVQALTKDFEQPILISETTFERVSASVQCEAIGGVPIRGKEKPMKLYRPVEIR